MSNDLEGSRQWRDTIETRLGTLEGRVDEEARLRAAMDEDMSGLRVQPRVLQSIVDTQSDHTRQLRELGEKIGGLDEKIGGLDEKIGGLDEKIGELDEKMRTGFARVHVGVDAVLDLLGGDSGSDA